MLTLVFVLLALTTCTVLGSGESRGKSLHVELTFSWRTSEQSGGKHAVDD